jgi:hypothetical protein
MYPGTFKNTKQENCFFDRLRPDRDDDINEDAKSLFSEFCLIKNQAENAAYFCPRVETTTSLNKLLAKLFSGC